MYVIVGNGDAVHGNDDDNGFINHEMRMGNRKEKPKSKRQNERTAKDIHS